ncbi:hypothetical protein JHL18_14870 [Clostridium sp. YIM B02505]|uniref:Uncharacterized protein n=1 Tax=Clostridium yunnanense TaxID=2800325 RepID=A0ABS1ERA4_9CLOT|nr:hypothetical protein [Clostridium yunnanense]MBK1811902.1 hypothetical protein [Clostridium yunnanense]
MTILVILLALIIGFIECGPLIKKGMKKESYTVLFMLLLAITFQICSKFKIFTPKNLVESILEPIGRAVFRKM